MEATKSAAVIRTWSNNANIVKTVHRALNAGLGQVIVVVKDDESSHYGNVEALLTDTLRSHGEHIIILPMRVGYTWSNALNYAFDEVRRRNLRAAIHGSNGIEFVLNVSNEALFEPDHFRSMLAVLSSDSELDAVGTSFAGKKNGDFVELGKSYQNPRNTMMLVRFQAYLDIGGYSPRCDALGGQEDLEWLMRLKQKDGQWKMLDLKVPLIVDANYDQAMKEARELKAIHDIKTMYAEIDSSFSEAIERLSLNLHRPTTQIIELLAPPCRSRTTGRAHPEYLARIASRSAGQALGHSQWTSTTLTRQCGLHFSRSKESKKLLPLLLRRSSPPIRELRPLT